MNKLRSVSFIHLGLVPRAFVAVCNACAQRPSGFQPQPAFHVRPSSRTTNNPFKGETAVDEPRRIWPRQMPEEQETITPPSSTSIAATSKEPLFKDLFRGQLHLELLEFPELTNQKDVNSVNQLHEKIKHFILRLDSEQVDRDGSLPHDFWSTMGEQGLLGLQIDRGFGGRGLTHFQAARAWEAIGLDLSVFCALNIHSLVSRVITSSGAEEQKRLWLPKLAAGECIGALCLAEVSSGSDQTAILTEAVPTDDAQTYVLNGTKTWTTNGTSANLLLVLARVPKSPSQSPSDTNITAFLVDVNSPGVTRGTKLDTLGVRGSGFTDIVLDKVRVPASNVLGEVGGGLDLIKSAFDREFLNLAASSTGLLRYLISYATEHCLQRHQFGRPIGDYGLVQRMLADLALNLYAMESGVFYFAGILDAQPSRDLSLEMAALKVFCSEALWSGVNTCVQLAGRTALLQSVPFSRYLRDCRSILFFGGTNDLLRLRLAGSGLQHIAHEVDEKHRKLHVYTRHPLLAMKTLMAMEGRKRGWYAKYVGAGPKVTEGGASQALKDHVHPNFAAVSSTLAILIQRLLSLSEALLITHGQAIVDEQMALARAADCATDLMLSAICLGRASRAISIGLPLHDYEVRLATTFVKLACKRVEANLTALQEFDRDRHRVASELLTHRNYPVVHPLSRVW